MIPDCDVCGKNDSVGVAAIPYLPISVAYCRDCLEANAHPLWALVGNTATMYSGEGDTLEDTAVEWREMVFDTLKHLGISREQFDEDVRREAASLQEVMALTENDDLLYQAWGVIANVSGGDWLLQSEEWQEAAVAWREKYHAFLSKQGLQDQIENLTTNASSDA